MVLPWLRCDGIWIKDEYGNRIQLRGFCCDYTANGNFDLLVSMLKKAKALGMNCVRLIFAVPNHRTWGATAYDEATMDHVLDLCQQNGLWGIFERGGYGEFVEQGWTQEWHDTWLRIAEHHKDDPRCAGYELDNEPYGIYFPDVAVPLLNDIRKIDTKHIIYLAEYTGSWWSWCNWKEGDIYPGRRFWKPPGEPGYGTVLPSDTNIALTAHHWPNTKYGTVDFASMQGQASEYLYGIVALRELFNRPVIAGEFGTYDYTAGSPQNDDYFMNVMRMSELLGVPWWSYDVYGPGLTQDWDYIIPVPYTSNLVPPYVPVPFDAVCLPFNMMSYISGWNRREIGYNIWGVSYYQFASGNDYIIFSKPCKVRITTWDNPDDFYAGRPPTRETIVSVAAGSRLNIANYYSPGFTFAFAYWVPRLTIKSSPISGVPITVDGQAVDGTSITIPLEEGSHQVSVPTEVEVY